MDTACIGLCAAVNLFPGIETVESCCGHGERPYRIWFTATSLYVLPALLFWIDGCHSGIYGWRTFVRTDCAMSPVTFCLEGPVDSDGSAYREAAELAKVIREAEKNGELT